MVTTVSLAERDWVDTLEWLPADLDVMLVKFGGLQRRRSVRSGEEVLRLCLAYSLLDLSLPRKGGPP